VNKAWNRAQQFLGSLQQRENLSAGVVHMEKGLLQKYFEGSTSAGDEVRVATQQGFYYRHNIESFNLS